MKLPTKILLLIAASILAGGMVVNACGDKDKIELRAEEEELQVDSSPDFPMVNTLIKF